MIRIAIDGPGGAGKSSLAKEVAKRLGIIYVDTGALYRTIGLYMLNHGIDPSDSERVVPMLSAFTLELKYVNGKQVILLDGADVGDSIRAPEVSLAASAVSAIKEVRDFLLNTQRSIAEKNSVIMDGRDIGTVILPNADVKIFLTASPEARAKRRYEELKAKGKDVTYEQVYTEMVERDRNDSTRDIAPCKPAEDAIMLDNSDLTAEQTVKRVIKIVKKAERKKKNRLYSTLRFCLVGIIKFFLHIKPVNVKNIPKDGGYVICANHVAIRDVFLIAAACPRQINFVAKRELFSVPIIGSLIKALGAIKLDRGGNDVGAIKASVNAAKSGNIVAIFPQGHRYPGVNPAATPRKNGAGMIAYRAKVGLIPVALKAKDNKYRLFRKVEVIFGKPIEYAELGFTDGGNEEYKNATDTVFAEIVRLGDFNSLPSPSGNEESAN